MNLHDPRLMKTGPAVIGFLLAMLLGLRVVAESEITGKIGDCASNQPELRKLFPAEMRMFKNFEGILSDISYRKGGGLQNRTYFFNANRKEIRFQTSVTNDIGDSKTEKPALVKICKTETGMQIKGEGVDIPFMVLSNKEIRMKLNANWYPFYRIQDVHGNFLPEGERKMGQPMTTSTTVTAPSGRRVESAVERAGERPVAAPVEGTR